MIFPEWICTRDDRLVGCASRWFLWLVTDCVFSNPVSGLFYLFQVVGLVQVLSRWVFLAVLGSWPGAAYWVYGETLVSGFRRTSHLSAFSLYPFPNHVYRAQMASFWQRCLRSGLEDHGLTNCNNFAASFGLAGAVPSHGSLVGFWVSGVILWMVAGFFPSS